MGWAGRHQGGPASRSWHPCAAAPVTSGRRLRREQWEADSHAAGTSEPWGGRADPLACVPCSR